MASVLRHRDCHQAESLINTLDDHQVPRTLKINNNVTLLQSQRSQAHMRLVECEEEFPLAEQLCEIALRHVPGLRHSLFEKTEIKSVIAYFEV